MSTDVSEVPAASIITVMMVAARTSEKSVDIQLRTWQYIPDDSELHNRRRENLKSHSVNKFVFVMVMCCVLFETRTGFLNIFFRRDTLTLFFQVGLGLPRTPLKSANQNFTSIS
jgi:hypothetical protein